MTRRRGRGRPQLFTPAKQKQYLKALAGGATQAKAAAAVGISARTIRQHATDDTEFATASDTAREQGKLARIPHGAYRYRHLGCRCRKCTAEASKARAGRRANEKTRPKKRAEVRQLPRVNRPEQGTPRPLRAVS